MIARLFAFGWGSIRATTSVEGIELLGAYKRNLFPQTNGGDMGKGVRGNRRPPLKSPLWSIEV